MKNFANNLSSLVSDPVSNLRLFISCYFTCLLGAIFCSVWTEFEKSIQLHNLIQFRPKFFSSFVNFVRFFCFVVIFCWLYYPLTWTCTMHIFRNCLQFITLVCSITLWKVFFSSAFLSKKSKSTKLFLWFYFFCSIKFGKHIPHTFLKMLQSVLLCWRTFYNIKLRCHWFYFSCPICVTNSENKFSEDISNSSFNFFNKICAFSNITTMTSKKVSLRKGKVLLTITLPTFVSKNFGFFSECLVQIQKSLLFIVLSCCLLELPIQNNSKYQLPPGYKKDLFFVVHKRSTLQESFLY